MPKNLKEMLANMDPARVAKIQARAAMILAEMPLQELRQARHLSQTTLAKTMDIPQSNVSRIERQTDIYVSTVRSYVEAMGGQLDIIASFPDGKYRVNQFEEIGDGEEYSELQEV